MPASQAQARAAQIKLLLFDVDGVLTDGTIWLFPAPAGAPQVTALARADLSRTQLASPAGAASQPQASRDEFFSGLDVQAGGSEATKQMDAPGFGIQSATIIEAKGFNAHDGTGISLARMGGLRTGIITKRISETVALRARDLKLDHVRQGIQDKLTVFEEILRAEKLSAEQAAYVGDDIIDLPVMQRCGLAIAVANARTEVKEVAHFVTEHRGGEGAARDAIEFVLRAQGSWQRVMQAYLESRTK